MNIGENIKIARKKAGLNQEELGDLLKYSRATIVNIEKNRHNINQEKIQQLCKVLKVSPNFIITGRDSGLTKDEIFKEECFEQMYYKLKLEFDTLKSHISSIIKIVTT